MTILGARSRRTVLVVEDALTTRCILEQFFARAGCEVLQASDPETALMRLKTSLRVAIVRSGRARAARGLRAISRFSVLVRSAARREHAKDALCDAKASRPLSNPLESERSSKCS